jgi:hypothetical protein
MPKDVSRSDIIAWPFLLPGNIACRAIGSEEHSALVRMLVNSLVWTVLGVMVVWIVA